MLNFLLDKLYIYLHDNLNSEKKLLLIKIINIILFPLILIVKLLLFIFHNPFSRYIYFESLKNKLLVVNSNKEKYILHSDDKVLSKFLYINGTYDFSKFESALKICYPDASSNPIDLLVNIGANIGSVCIPAVNRKYAKKSIAVEPDPRNYRSLVTNIYINNLQDKITHYCNAISDKNDKDLQLELSEYNFADHRISVSNTEGIYSETKRKKVNVKSKTLDYFVDFFNQKRNLIYMDVQGYEGIVLQGCPKIIAMKIPIILEVWPYGLNRVNSYDILIKMVKKYTYLYDLSEKNPKKRSSVEIEEIINNLGRNSTRYVDILIM